MAFDPMLDALYGTSQDAGAVIPKAAAGGAIASKIKGMTKGGKGLKFGGTLLGWLLAQRLVEGIGAAGDRKVQGAAIRSQENINSAENLYARAALPQAQQEEDMARQALFNQLAGGVLGPSLAKGETKI